MLRCAFCVALLLLGCGGSAPAGQLAGQDVAQDAIDDVPLADAATAETQDTAAVDATDVGADTALPVCPSPVIEVLEGDEVVPQTTLHLSGKNSTAGPGATVASYKWTVKQPAGSTQTLAPSSTSANPTFVANAVGEYSICLDVTDSNGLAECAQACVTVKVVAEDLLHIELLWDTPADPDQTDTGPKAGADLDLHFASDLAKGPDTDCDGAPDPWFNNPFDCYGLNPSPQWGSTDPAILDDPTLDLDDTDGAGPENLNLSQPEGTTANPRQYPIGVHYKDDHGFGVSYATVTVYLYGTILLKVDTIPMKMLDLWYLGKLNWPNQLSSSSVAPIDICYQTAGSNPGDVCAGKAKMWQPQGEWCVTPNYKAP